MAKKLWYYKLIKEGVKDMRRFLRYLWQVPAIIIPAIFQYFFWLLPYSINPDKYPLEKRFRRCQKLIRYVLKVLMVDVHIKGMENLENLPDNYLIMPNHRSNFDPIMIIAVSPKPITFVAKKETYKMPFAGRIIRVLKGSFLDRNDLRQQLKIMKDVEMQMIENKAQNWAIFPEGTRNKNGDPSTLLEFHHGSFRSAMNNDFTIIPTVINGTGRILSFKYFKRIPVEVSFTKPIKASECGVKNSKQLADYTADIVNKELQVVILEDKKHLNALKPKRKRDPELNN